jgi:hypothetical protein
MHHELIGNLTFYKTMEAIDNTLLTEKVDLIRLKKISRQPGGYIDNNTRSRVWPKLLCINRFNIPDYRGFITPHRDDLQLKADISRSLWSHESTKIWSENLRNKRRKSLSNIIVSILCRNSDFHYYQGYHDVVSVFLLVAGHDQLAFAMAEIVSRRFLIDFLGKDFEILSKSMRLIMTIIEVTDPELGGHLSRANVEPFFATSWLITWFSHDEPCIDKIARMYDALLCSHPLFIFYLCAAMVISIREDVLECECDFASLYDLLVHAPAVHGIFFEKLLMIADNLILKITPDKLRRLSNKDLKHMIDCGHINCFKEQKSHKISSVASDWILLKNMRIKTSPILTATLSRKNPSIQIYSQRLFTSINSQKNNSERVCSYIESFDTVYVDDDYFKFSFFNEKINFFVISQLDMINSHLYSTKALMATTSIVAIVACSAYIYHDNSVINYDVLRQSLFFLYCFEMKEMLS